MKEHHTFLILITLCLTVGTLLAKGSAHFDALSYNEWMHVLLRVGATLFLFYAVLLGSCIAKITAKYEMTLVLKVLLVALIALVLLLIPNSALYSIFGTVSLLLSLVWLLLQGVHHLDNTQVLHNFLVLNILNVKRGPQAGAAAGGEGASRSERRSTEEVLAEAAAATKRSQAWLYVHLASSFTVMCILWYLCHRINALLRLAKAYDVACLVGSHVEVTHHHYSDGSSEVKVEQYSDDYVRKMYDTHRVAGVVLVLLSLPRFTNKGMLIPLMLYLYQLHLLMITMLLKMDSCDNTVAFKAILDVDERTDVMHRLEEHSTFIRQAVLVLSLGFLLQVVLYNLAAPNLVSLRNIMRGSLWDRRISKTSEAVTASMLRFTADEEGGGEAARLVARDGDDDAASGYGSTDGRSITIGGSTRSHNQNTATLAAGLSQPAVPLAMTEEDRSATPVPAYFVYFVLLSAYLPMLLSHWSLMVRHGHATPTTITLDDGTQYQVIAEGGGANNMYGLLGTGGQGSGLHASTWVGWINLTLFVTSISLWVFFTACLFVSYIHRDSI